MSAACWLGSLSVSDQSESVLSDSSKSQTSDTLPLFTETLSSTDGVPVDVTAQNTANIHSKSIV